MTLWEHFKRGFRDGWRAQWAGWNWWTFLKSVFDTVVVIVVWEIIHGRLS
jgi:hypothetical protein